jgi:hypothetical protein
MESAGWGPVGGEVYLVSQLLSASLSGGGDGGGALGGDSSDIAHALGYSEPRVHLSRTGGRME